MTTTWQQVPSPVEVRTRVPLVVPWLLAAVPLRRVLEANNLSVDGVAWKIALVLGAAAIALRLWPRLLPLTAAAAAGAVVALVPDGFGPRYALVSVVPLVFWMIATGSSDPPYRWVPPGRVFRPCLVPIGLAGLSMLLAESMYGAQRCVLVACALAGVTLVVPGPIDRGLTVVERRVAPLTRVLGRVQHGLGVAGRHLGRAIGVVVTLPAALLLVVTWAGQRLVGYDPLRAPAARGSWVRRAGGDPEPQRLFTGGSVVDPGGVGWSLRRGAAALISLAVVVGAILVAIPGAQDAVEQLNREVGAPLPLDDPPCFSGGDQALGDDPGFPEVICDTAEYSVNGRFSAVTTYSMADFASDNVNVEGGIRRTWTPPECDCERVKVWLFGGSAAFGWWQADEHTIASQLAQQAWEEGIALDIEVRANPGWVLGQEQRLFDQLSVSEEELPDVVLFYDGGNELQRQRFRNEAGRGADESPTSYAEDDIDRLLRQGPFPWYAGEQLDDATTSDDELLPPDEVAEHAMNRYLRDLELARRSTGAADVEALFFWQPLLVTAGRAAGDPEALPDADWELYTEMVDTARGMLPDDVIDLSDVLDDVDHPVYKDLFHHNVEAAGIIAASMLDDLRPLLPPASDG